MCVQPRGVLPQTRSSYGERGFKPLDHEHQEAHGDMERVAKRGVWVVQGTFRERATVYLKEAPAVEYACCRANVQHM